MYLGHDTQLDRPVAIKMLAEEVATHATRARMLREARTLASVDHPAIVRAFYELSKLVNEGTPVSGRGPAAEGQTPTGRTERPTAASALYPNLRSASR